MSVRSFVVAVLGCLPGMSGALGQDAAYLSSEPRRPAPGQGASLALERARAGAVAREAWPGDRASWLFIRAGGNQENRHDVAPGAAGAQSIPFTMPGSPLALIGLDLAAVVDTMDAAALAAFRAEKLPADAPDVAPGRSRGGGAAPGEEIRVRRLESATLLVRASGPGADAGASSTATAKAGQRAEVRAIMDPTALRAGSDLPVRVFARGSAIAGARIRAVREGGEEQVVTADSSGIAKVRLDEPGAWRIEFHHLEKCADPAAADWDLYTATLSFEAARPAAGEVK